jgi:TRAP-type C4-dicarboxylate transport system substrate-binding protein
VHYLYSLQPLVVGEGFFKKQSPEMQELITKCGLEAQQYALLYQMMEANKAKEGLIAEGMEVMDLEDEDKWIELATSKVWPQFYESVGGKAKVDEVLKILGR